ncbi:MAG: dynamin family protein [Rhodobacter sp.]|nr:dynamin family protein [Rhodobacter sp.]
MNAETKFPTQPSSPVETYGPLATAIAEPFAPMVAEMAGLATALNKLGTIGDGAASETAARLKAKLENTEPSVTMIGQVKAGKTTLVNAMVGWPDLLPADVNPWTSVVTSLHLSPTKYAGSQKAQFQFFDSQEWERLVLGGGRVGELAGRAGADNEIEKVRRQIAEMQEKSRQRLGRKFELLLGQRHDYENLDANLVERYVCLGDDFEDDSQTSKHQGRFADITKTADLFLHRPELPLPLCIRDTPGVNDTFMVREQITIRAIRDSRICVVVLSAHQALSSVDMALIRLIANVKSREIIIFVNRIDELSDPARQVSEIETSIRATLREHKGPEDAKIIFGSAYWANHALQDFRHGLSKDSTEALKNWASIAKGIDAKSGRQNIVWQLSGLPTLFEAVSERIAGGVGRELIDAVTRDARNLCAGIKVSNNITTLKLKAGSQPEIDREKLAETLRRLASNGERLVDQEFDKLLQEFGARIDRSHQSFLQRATAALIDHIEANGETTSWKYDPTGLRLLFRSSYQLFAKRATSLSKNIFAAASRDLTALYRQLNFVDDPAFALEPPPAPRIAPPILLGQTIALDLQSNWWSRWWRKRRGYEAYANEFSRLIQAETEPIATGMKTDHAQAVRHAATTTLTEFIKEQSKLLFSLAEQVSAGGEDPAQFENTNEAQDRQAILAEVKEFLGESQPIGASQDER